MPTCESEFTICALMFGDYPQLAERLLGSLCTGVWDSRGELRVGANQVSSATMKVILNYVHEDQVHIGEKGVLKYPMMRRLLYCEPLARYTMWFDDDSWIDPQAPSGWFNSVRASLQSYDMVGAPYRMRLRGNQHLWIQDQPWYTGKIVHARDSIAFITGGWWAIKSDILKDHDWPTRELQHNGGDILLGALCRQQGYRLGRFTSGVRINANDTGKCSTASRRGFSQQPLGTHYTR